MAPTQISELAKAVDKMYRDFYLGEGKDAPSITTRMALVEEQLERMSGILTWVIRAVIGELLIVAGEVLMRLLKLL